MFLIVSTLLVSQYYWSVGSETWPPMPSQTFVASAIHFANLLPVPSPSGEPTYHSQVGATPHRHRVASSEELADAWQDVPAQEIEAERMPVVVARLKERELQRLHRVVRCLTMSVGGERLYVVQSRDTGEDFLYSRSRGFITETAAPVNDEDLRVPLTAPKRAKARATPRRQ